MPSNSIRFTVDSLEQTVLGYDASGNPQFQFQVVANGLTISGWDGAAWQSLAHFNGSPLGVDFNHGIATNLLGATRIDLDGGAHIDSDGHLFDDNGIKIIGDQVAAIADASGVLLDDTRAINAILAALRNHGLIAT